MEEKHLTLKERQEIRLAESISNSVDASSVGRVKLAPITSHPVHNLQTAAVDIEPDDDDDDETDPEEEAMPTKKRRRKDEE